MEAHPAAAEIRRDGFTLARGVFPPGLFEAFRSEVVAIAEALCPGIAAGSQMDLDKIWMTLAGQDRKLASKLYDALKHSAALRRFAVDPGLLEIVGAATGGPSLALVDVNFRIDAPGEDHFLFSWHQDYWFSICSPKALVAWIPMTAGDEGTGGIECFPLQATGGRILKARGSDSYRSYSDAILLDEALPEREPLAPRAELGDALLFSFDLLHRSRPNRSRSRCRWTAQLRFVNYSDPYFRDEGFRPGIVTKDCITYLNRLEGRTHE